MITHGSLIARMCMVLVVASLLLSASHRPAAAEELLITPSVAAQVATLPPSASGVQGARAGRERTLDVADLQDLKTQHKAGGSVMPETVASLASTGPSILQRFGGLQQSDSSFIPPDSQVAAGPAHIVEAVNLAARIWTKGSPPIVVGTFDLGALFNVDDSVLSDPKVRFDPQSQRWYIATISFQTPTGAWHLAVSTSNDPTGTYAVYTIPSQNGTYPDFTAMGMSDDKVVLSGNAFETSGAQNFKGTEYVVLNKAELVAGGTVHGTFHKPPQGLFTIQPAHTLPSTTGSTTTLYMASVAFNRATKVRVWSLTGVPGVGHGVTVKTKDLNIPLLTSPPNAEQAGSDNLIVTNDSSVLDAVVRDGSLWLAANSACKPTGDSTIRACMRFMQIQTGATLKVSQAFDVGAPGWYYYYPAIQVDGADNLLAVFSGSSASTFASVYAGGQPAGQPNLFSAPILIRGGKAAYERDRWGDFSGAGIDSNDATVWIAGEYAKPGNAWGTHIAEIGF